MTKLGRRHNDVGAGLYILLKPQSTLYVHPLVQFLNTPLGAEMDMALLENVRWEVTGGRERVRQDDDRVERVGWMVKSSRRYVGWRGNCRLGAGL